MKNVLMDTNQGSTTTIDGMPIGRLTPAPGNFSELAVNGEPITPGGGLTLDQVITYLESLPTSLPVSSGQLWNNAGVISIS